MVAPTKIFFARGVGVHKDRLASFELALRQGGIERCNLVYVSSTFPPMAKEISQDEGLRETQSSQLVYCVMARDETNDQTRLVSAAFDGPPPREPQAYGCPSEHHAFGETEEISGGHAEDLAATMLATTLGIVFDHDSAWQEREQFYNASGTIVETKNICQAAQGDPNGLWTTMIAAAVFV